MLVEIGPTVAVRQQFAPGADPVAAETGGLYFARTTGFRKALDRIDDRNRSWYQLAVPDDETRNDGFVPSAGVRVSGCPECRILVGRR
jgi:hypothetical protein